MNRFFPQPSNNITRRRQSARALIASALCVALPLCAHGQVSVDVVALTGDSTPIVNTTYEIFDFARINDTGTVAFQATIAGPAVTEANDRVVFIQPGANVLVGRLTGTTAIGAATLKIDSVAFAALTAKRRFAILSGLYDSATSERARQAMFTSPGGTFQLLVHEGNATLPGYTELIEALPNPNKDDAVAFSASVVDPTGAEPTGVLTGAGVWTDRAGALELLVKRTDPAVGVPSGFVFDHCDNPSQNNAGHIAFRALLNDPVGAPEEFRHAIYRDSGSGLELLAWASPTGSNIDRFSVVPQIDKDDRVVSWHHDRNASAAQDTALVRFDAQANATDLVREGDVAPGTSSMFSDILPAFTMNDFGDVAFVGVLADPPTEPNIDNTGVWKITNGQMELVALENDAVPALGPGVFINTIGHATISHSGRVAFVTTLRGAGVDRPTAIALLAQDVSGALIPVVRTGDEIDVSGAGDLRIVRTFDYDHQSSVSGHAQFSAMGDIAMVLHFETPDAQQILEYSSAIVAMRVGCAADFDSNGVLNILDYIAFGDAFAAGSASADLHANSVLDILDFILFGDLFAAGCP